jgi:NTP pyrophosphatase (non-canonical NTP hydrolase)
MDFNDYQKQSRATAIYPTLEYPDEEGNLSIGFIYPAMGLAGETGEVLEKCKKILRDDRGIPSNEKVADIEKEIGDVMWYIAQLCTEFDLNMSTCAEKNLAKLASRKERGVLQGSGDNR